MFIKKERLLEKWQRDLNTKKRKHQYDPQKKMKAVK